MQMKLYRIGHWLYCRRLYFLAKVVQRLIFLLYNAVIPSATEIGEGSYFAHGGLGSVVHHNAKIGKGVLISQGVTIGGKSLQSEGLPIIGDDVYIGAGAKILGNITIGKDSLIGANAVVIQSVPEGSLVVGVPAKIKKMGIRAREHETW